MSGGWLTLVLGELLVGIVIGLTWRFVGRSSSPRAWLVYAVLATTFANSGLDWFTLVRTLIEFTIFYLPVARLLFPRSFERQDPNPAPVQGK
jgi:Kef-type K+ transport system membrane component KefB